MKTKTIILTGGTGVFGKYLIEDLLKGKPRIILLVRADSQKQANDRVKKLFKSNSLPPDKVTVLNCNLTQKNLGLNSENFKILKQTTTHILHAAASTKFTLPLDEARRNNVETTMKLLAFARNCKNLERFGFVSTAFVAGKRSGIILEEEFEHSAGFLNTYEESKYEAEMIVRSMINLLPIVIFRPSLIITPYKKSDISPVNALTLGLFLARKGFLPILPGYKENKLDIIGGTVASQVVAKIFLKEALHYSTYHVTSAEKSPSIENFIRIVEQQSGKKLPMRFCGDIENYLLELKKITRFRPDLTAIYRKTQSFLPELAFPKIYDNRNLLDELELKSFSHEPINLVQAILK
ncbi:hypothetical protein A2865_02575 [Candidatus Woesebacteria bacterium RIFCSPHIGHO2_01_FULL_39_17]|uniref:Long-chain-fatty-acid-CoA ligase n=3 Tax=Candidatus Woeseibacteriota TaxID=1752722 RepID=A0A0G0QUA0_9BACT|nr:MAG: Long-chain-fatty-acid-CoA ligase [Microgenomates group bacterium GW2011_GWC1_38_12]KKQ94518.1 MAG: Long-chain-fatty-acid-CoA ligase [Candidatus Woesebacteria bacterium GW2011_GWB1_39_10b]KKR13915.1 MAG: Long-chain-fatty-acid-CoA ligase [Candidatus Woesebacteria bacterium GW2011_GWA1_39_21b]OGM22476.1 MAG: hypothetical protein A2865_02575 [Candidatus Woesebacteria bacterium RIFCSPHIGHO2_01_FULL_39_17]OGM65541.1 MAG: hypothetical protein A3A52_01530 [Candidatus Woesebacteria bacterium RIF